MPGSIGAGGPQRTFKGIRMGGHMGDAQVTVKNLEIVKIDLANNTIAIKGAVPGARGSLITISATDGNIWN
jgi:large subunit ribosomal protein L3